MERKKETDRYKEGKEDRRKEGFSTFAEKEIARNVKSGFLL